MHIELKWLQAAIRAHKGDAPIMAMLEAVAPLIRDAALEEAAMVADAHYRDNHQRLSDTRSKRSDIDFATFEGAMSGADSVAYAIRALKTKEPTNDADA